MGFGGFDRLLPGLGWGFERNWRVAGWFGVILSSLVIIVLTKPNKTKRSGDRSCYNWGSEVVSEGFGSHALV